MLKKIIVINLTLFFIFCVVDLPILALGKERPHRIINVVFDDSGSTVINSTTWAHERYAMQLFAAMLEEKDVLNIFMMSKSLEADVDSNPDYVIKGTSNINERVANVYNIEATNTRGTPFSSVERAYQNITSSADTQAEKWLVVLTDGNFDENINVSDKYAQYVSQTEALKIVTLAIGEDIAESLPAKGPSVDTYYASSADKVITQLAEICNRMFSRNQLATTSTITLDVPVEEIFVLAQGETVTIDSQAEFSTEIAEIKILRDDKGKATVNESYVDDVKTIQLMGKVASIKAKDADYIDIGDYNLEISGAENINVYYKPKVDLEIVLEDETGQVVKNDSLEEGVYKISLLVVHPQTRQILNSKMLGDVEYDLTFDGNPIKPGDTITIDEGLKALEGRVSFLKYNEITINKTLSVNHVVTPLEIRDLKLEPLSLSSSAQNEGKVLFSLYQGNDKIAQELWEKMDLPKISCEQGVDFIVTKYNDVGTFQVIPQKEQKNTLFDGKVMATIYVQLTDLDGDTVEAEQLIEIEVGGVVPLRFDGVKADSLSLEKLETNDRAIAFSLYRDNMLISEAVWREMKMPEIQWQGDIEFEVVKGDEVGQFFIVPAYHIDKFSTFSGDLPIRIFAEIKDEAGDLVSAENVIELSIVDDISVFDKFTDWFKKHFVLFISLLFLLIVILGYIPPFKKYLPRSMKKRPTIVVKPNGLGARQTENGSFNKKIWTLLVPYKAEEGIVRMAPIGVSPAVPRLHLKAVGNKAMHIKNYKNFAGRENISFNGMSIDKEARKSPRIRAGTMCNVKTELYTSSCTLNN